MAEALQHDQTAFIARISATCATDDEPVPDTARSGRANAIISLSHWYNNSIRPPPTFGLRNRFSYYFINDLRLNVANVLLPFSAQLSDAFTPLWHLIRFD
jgi:hypothetical protein